MCNVCVATEVLRETSDGRQYAVVWFRDSQSERQRRLLVAGARVVLMQAVGKPQGRARYRLRLNGQRWPRKWSTTTGSDYARAIRRMPPTAKTTTDLAGVISAYGLDVNWEHVPKCVRDWVKGKARKPTVEQARDEMQVLRPVRVERQAA